MKSALTRIASTTAPAQRAAAAPDHARSTSAQPFDASPRQAAQLQAMEGLRPTSAGAAMPVQMGRKNKKGNNQDAKKDRENRKKSASDRAQNKLAQYSGDTVKHQQKVVKNAKTRREINESLQGHASRPGGNKQNAATTKSLKEISEKTAKAAQEEKKQARQAQANKQIGNWKKNFHDDKDDRGGAGFGHGILV